MGEPIKKLTIEGFKSIRKLEDFELRSLNVMIGANGAGKSNFVAFFRLLRELIEQRLQLAVTTEGGADALLYMGPKVTRQFVAKLYFGNNGYAFALKPTADNRLVFADESALFFRRIRPLLLPELGSHISRSNFRESAIHSIRPRTSTTIPTQPRLNGCSVPTQPIAKCWTER
jgi:predicted ATPase